MNVIELRNKIRSYTVRSDLTDDLINGFIIETETAFRRDIGRHRLSEKTVDLTANVLIGAATLPTDFREARSVQLDGVPISLVSVDTRSKCKATSEGYYLSGDRLVLVPPPADSGGKVNLVYYATVPGLTDASPTNWISDSFPDVYLHGVLARAYTWLRDAEGKAMAYADYGNAIATIAQDQRISAYSGSTMVVPKGAGF